MPALKSSNETTWVEVGQIEIGSRVRKDLGDINALAKSIETVGILHPVVLDKSKNLISGFRRIQAYKSLGEDMIPCHLVDDYDDAVKYLLAERDENTCRKDFTPSEAVAAAAAIEELEEEAAAQRKAATQFAGKDENGKPKKNQEIIGKENFSSPKGKSSAITAKAVGMSRPTYEKAKEVVKAAEEEPETFKEIEEEMDRTGKVDPAYRKVQEKKNKSPSNPRGTYEDAQELLDHFRDFNAGLKRLSKLRPKSTMRGTVIEAARKTIRSLESFISSMER